MFKNNKIFNLIAISSLVLFAVFIISLFVPKQYFISWGDFRMQIFWDDFINKQIYIWSDQNSALNIDGIIRFFARLPLVLIFGITQSNILTSYFYIIFVSLFNILLFAQFSNKILKINDKWLVYSMSILYAFNPAFLGNFSKIGLIFGTTALLGVIIYTFEIFKVKKIFPYSIILTILFNVSLIHPFQFVVNFLVFLVISLVLTFKNLEFIKTKIKPILLSFFLAILAHTYAFVTLFTSNSVSKEVISNSIGGDSSTLDLQNLAVTKTFLEGFTFSKSVFLDYNFYTQETKIIYYGLFSLVLIFVVILHFYFQRIKEYQKRANILFFLVIILVILTRGLTISFTKPFYDLINLLPVSWIFRSPLKWQLFVPLAFFPLLLLQLSYFKNKKIRLLAPFIVSLLFVIINSTLIYDISIKLFKPKTQNIFTELSPTDLKNSHTLLINSEKCGELARNNLIVFNELQHLLSSYQNTHLVLNISELNNNINLLKNFDYVISCNQSDINLSSMQERFKQIESKNNYGITFYQNKKPKDDIYQSDDVFSTFDTLLPYSNVLYTNIEDDSDVIYSTNKKTFKSGLYNNIFKEDIAIENFGTNTLTFDVSIEDLISNKFTIDESYSLKTYEYDGTVLKIFDEGIGEVFVNDSPIYKKEKSVDFSIIPTNNTITVNNQNIKLQSKGILGISKNISYIEIDGIEYTNQIIKFSENKKYSQVVEDINDTNTISIKSDIFSFTNLISNDKFIDSPWESGLENCFSYDDKPQIELSYQKLANPYITIDATRHIGCTSENVNTIPNTPIFVSYKHRSNMKGLYGFSLGQIGTNALKETLFQGSNLEWDTYQTSINEGLPDTNSVFKLKVVEGLNNSKNSVDFDDVFITNFPNLNSFIYQEEKPQTSKSNSEVNINYKKISPTKYTVQMNNVLNGQFLFFKQRFDNNWELKGKDGFILDTHAIGNQIFNSWYIDPSINCNNLNCIQNTDGTYTISFEIEYSSQKFVNYSITFSSIIFLLFVVYLLINFRLSQKNTQS